MEEQEPCRHCGKSIREQMKGCNQPYCYRQHLKDADEEDFKHAIKKHEGIHNGYYFISTAKSAESCYILHSKERRKWREEIEKLKRKHELEVTGLKSLYGKLLIDLSKMTEDRDCAVQAYSSEKMHNDFLISAADNAISALEFVMDKMKPVDPVDQSDAFNLPANAITMLIEALDNQING